MTEPESQMKARLTFQKNLTQLFHADFSSLSLCGALLVVANIYMKRQPTWSRNMHSVVHVIFDATRKYGNRGLAVGRKSGRGLHDINSKTDIDLRISVKFGPLGWIGLCFTWFLWDGKGSLYTAMMNWNTYIRGHLVWHRASRSIIPWSNLGRGNKTWLHWQLHD